MTDCEDASVRPHAASLSRIVREHIVDDAPDDCDDVMESIPRSPGWVRVLFCGAALVVTWMLIFMGTGWLVAVLLHAFSRARVAS